MLRALGQGHQRIAQYETAVAKPLKESPVSLIPRPMQKAKYPMLPLLLLRPLLWIHCATGCPPPLRCLQQLPPRKPASTQTSCGAL